MPRVLARRPHEENGHTDLKNIKLELPFYVAVTFLNVARK